MRLWAKSVAKTLVHVGPLPWAVMPEHPQQPPTAGDRLMKIGMVITVVGMVFSLIALIPIRDGEDPPSWLWWMAMSSGLGLAIVLVGLRRAAIARRNYLRSLTIEK